MILNQVGYYQNKNRFQMLKPHLDLNNQKDVSLIWRRMATEIEIKSMSYVNRYLSSTMEIGSVLFDRKRQIRWAGWNGLKQINSLGLNLKP